MIETEFNLPDGITMRDVQRLFAGVDFSGDCWEWQRSCCYGYGQLNLAINGKRTARQTHRLCYRILVGEVPVGLELDHLCRNRRCCNPDHLEPVTRKENIRRGAGPVSTVLRKRRQTHCKEGHPLSGENLYIGTSGGRVCRACRRANKWKYR